MRTAELRRLNDGELATELSSAREELFNLRFQLSTRQLKDYRAIERTRRKVARILTLQHERELAPEVERAG
ncbi:MAG: 50S ribosomal protein L29 [Chloroflexi bacterium 13_1_40CM_4_68_4]|nr:MAG: 50S ribosomal protein L29 [Chloroflexi bacterium 13_1_40CM_4_68_4]